MSYDEDHSDPRQFCQHGTFIGSWWGPDYMCGLCEDGVTVAEMLQGQASSRLREARQALKDGERLCELATEGMQGHPYNARLARVLVDIVWDTPKFTNAWRVRHLV